MGRLNLLILGVMCLFMLFPQVPAKNGSPVLFAFGDSNTDTGGANALYGSVTQYPNGMIFPYQLSERASNGRLIIDFLCENVHANYLNACLNSLDGPDFANGVNFAIAGATTKTPPIFLKFQIYQFQRFWNRSIGLQGSGQKIVEEKDFKQALYIIDIGQNDLVNMLRNSSSNMAESISEVVGIFQNAMKAVYQHGGRNFWIHNTGPLGCLPGSTALSNDRGLDQIGCIKYMNEAANMLNKNFAALCEQQLIEKNDSTIVYVDVYAIKYDLIANATSYGFENPLIACVVGNIPCENPSKHISWDGIHYTEAANAFVASKIITGHYSTPHLPFSFFNNGCT